MAILLHLTELCVCLPFHSVCEGVDGGVGRGFLLEGGRGRAPIVCVCVCVCARARAEGAPCVFVCVCVDTCWQRCTTSDTRTEPGLGWALIGRLSLLNVKKKHTHTKTVGQFPYVIVLSHNISFIVTCYHAYNPVKCKPFPSL